MSEKQNNAVVTATLNDKGYVVLTLSVKDMDNLSIKINDFGGKEKAKAKKIAYKLYKTLENEGK